MFLPRTWRTIERCVETQNEFLVGFSNQVYGRKEHGEYSVYVGNDYGNYRVLTIKNDSVMFFNPVKLNHRTTRVQKIIRSLYDVSKWEQ